MMSANRRDFLRIAAGGCGLGWAWRAPILAAAEEKDAPAWQQVPAILARIRPPMFPSRDFDVNRFGAAGDGVKDCTEAIRRAIDACAQAGGGHVVAPAGVFMTGPIRLKSNVNLLLAGGATLRFLRDPALRT